MILLMSPSVYNRRRVRPTPHRSFRLIRRSLQAAEHPGSAELGGKASVSGLLGAVVRRTRSAQPVLLVSLLPRELVKGSPSHHGPSLGRPCVRTPPRSKKFGTTVRLMDSSDFWKATRLVAVVSSQIVVPQTVSLWAQRLRRIRLHVEFAHHLVNLRLRCVQPCVLRFFHSFSSAFQGSGRVPPCHDQGGLASSLA